MVVQVLQSVAVLVVVLWSIDLPLGFVQTVVPEAAVQLCLELAVLALLLW